MPSAAALNRMACSVMTLNAATMAVRHALEQRWVDALAGFDATQEIGPLGTPACGDTVEGLTRLLAGRGVEARAWYGVLLFSDWMDLPVEDTDVDAVACVELEASIRDPYRQLSRAFHLVGIRSTIASTAPPGPIPAPGPGSRLNTPQQPF